MRILFPLSVLIAAQIGAAWAIGEPNTARIGGVLARAETETAEACERLCREDTLCMAWTFEAGVCRTSANVPPVVTRTGAVSGLSPRAPRQIHAQAVALPVAEAVAIRDEPIGEDAVQYEPALPEDAISAELLGGPLDEDLRVRLGN